MPRHRCDFHIGNRTPIGIGDTRLRVESEAKNVSILGTLAFLAESARLRSRRTDKGPFHGDARAVNVVSKGLFMNISDTLAAMPVSTLDLTRHVTVSSETSVADTVRTMCDAERSCALIVDEGKLRGVLTQRDVLMRAIGRPRAWDLPISEEMTTSLRTMRDSDSASDGLAIMNDWWVRSVPVLDGADGLVGNLSFYTIMSVISRLVAEHLGDIDQNPSDTLGLTLIDFTGLNTSHPVIVSTDESVEVAAHHMKARGIGSVLVVDARDNLVGVLTEFDLQMKVGCEVADLSTVKVDEVMTPNPIALAARSPISAAIKEMADRGFSHVPLLGESGRPVAVASFRDIAAYVETSFDAIG